MDWNLSKQWKMRSSQIVENNMHTRLVLDWNQQTLHSKKQQLLTPWNILFWRISCTYFQDDPSYFSMLDILEVGLDYIIFGIRLKEALCVLITNQGKGGLANPGEI